MVEYIVWLKLSKHGLLTTSQLHIQASNCYTGLLSLKFLTLHIMLPFFSVMHFFATFISPSSFSFDTLCLVISLFSSWYVSVPVCCFTQIKKKNPKRFSGLIFLFFSCLLASFPSRLKRNHCCHCIIVICIILPEGIAHGLTAQKRAENSNYWKTADFSSM